MKKRFFDLFFSSVGLVVLSPFFLLFALIIEWDSPGPVFFRQSRIGQDGKEFKLIKFRTMIVNADKFGPQITSAKDSRITNIGRLLRRSKIDELPQLINVIMGQMSLVGPRPEVPRYVNQWLETDKLFIL